MNELNGQKQKQQNILLVATGWFKSFQKMARKVSVLRTQLQHPFGSLKHCLLLTNEQ